jgi:hypothetical protein
MYCRRIWALVLIFGLALTVTPAFAQEPAQETAQELPTADDVLEHLRSTLAWYQQARVATQAAREGSVLLTTRDEEPTVLRVVQRAFEVARAQAALLTQAGVPSSTAETPAARRAQRRAAIETAIREGERELAQRRERAQRTPAARREPLLRDVTATEHRLAVDRLRLELLTHLEQADASLAPGQSDLIQEIQALQESVPELTSAATPAAKAPVVATPPADGTWSVVRRLLALQRARSQLGQLAGATENLAAEVDALVDSTRTSVRAMSRRLRDQTATAPAVGDAEQEFRRELERLKGMGGILVPLRGEAALLQRVRADVAGWQRGVDRETRRGVQDLVLGLVGVVVALGAILIGGLMVRVAVERYVTDPYRRRLLLRARKIAAGVAVVLVFVFHFTDELTALVTALGFAAAGVAFALQNVILSMAGYFSMMSPNGIRLGDRVSLQGPFGYVHGEVIEIGLVRIRLRELSAQTLEPTGRVVVFPNSVVFTGSFFKDPPAQAKAA